MAKYEKFEEWMVGKKVEDRDGDRGVVTRSHELGTNKVWVLWEDSWAGSEKELWSNVSHLKFLETGDSEQESGAIPWEVGQEVWDTSFGRGVVRSVYQPSQTTEGQVQVEFDSAEGNRTWYTLDGKYQLEKGATHRTLFFSEPKIIAETMPPKKPFVPKLKFDDQIIVINEHGKVECYGYVEQEFEDSVAMRTGEVYEKVYYSFFKLGEEIKWED